MEEILNLIKTGKIEEALKLLKSNSIPKKTIDDLAKEYNELDRELRDTQIGNIQKDKTVGTGDKRKTVIGVRIPIPFQNKIVTTATAFEVGNDVTLIPSEQNALSDEVVRLWRTNRIDSNIKKLISTKKSLLQSAMLFYIKDLKPNNLVNKFLGANQKKDIKVRILENTKGTMTPTFDAAGDMIFFTWEFSAISLAGKTVKYVWIYSDSQVFKMDNSNGTFAQSEGSGASHGFNKIPVVYVSQDNPEWYIATDMIDRLEVALSKLGASNDYTGHPILKLYGDVTGAPDKDEDGKAFRCDIKIDPETEKEIRSDVQFLTYDQAPEAVRLEMEKLEKYIYSLTSTPDLSFENLKGLGSISGVALKLMFLDAIIKAKMNEGDNRTMIERIINIFIAGTINTTNTTMKSNALLTYFDVKFNSIIPSDVKEAIEMYSQGLQGKIISQETAVESLGLTTDSKEELAKINAEEGSGGEE